MYIYLQCKQSMKRRMCECIHSEMNPLAVEQAKGKIQHLGSRSKSSFEYDTHTNPQDSLAISIACLFSRFLHSVHLNIPIKNRTGFGILPVQTVHFFASATLLPFVKKAGNQWVQIKPHLKRLFNMHKKGSLILWNAFSSAAWTHSYLQQKVKWSQDIHN